MEAYGQTLRIVVDAKFYSTKIDVKDVEEVLALADAVKANQVIIVPANGWTEPSGKKAAFHGCALCLFTLEEALDILVPDKWENVPQLREGLHRSRHGWSRRIRRWLVVVARGKVPRMPSRFHLVPRLRRTAGSAAR